MIKKKENLSFNKLIDWNSFKNTAETSFKKEARINRTSEIPTKPEIKNTAGHLKTENFCVSDLDLKNQLLAAGLKDQEITVAWFEVKLLFTNFY